MSEESLRCQIVFTGQEVINEMGHITLLPETTKNPLTLMGKRAGCCWGADITDDHRNYKRGLECLENNHGRVLEYVNVEAILEGYSARVIREWYTHIGGAPSRLQASTRYINYDQFQYVIPPTIQSNAEAWNIYSGMMSDISLASQELEALDIPREDIAMLLPLGMETAIVDKRNLRNIIDMSRQRECTRAYWEFRMLFTEYKNKLADLSEEWEYIVERHMKPKCKVLGYCPEKFSCGKKPKMKENDMIVSNN